MRAFALLTGAPLLLAPLACTLDNPAYDDCTRVGQCLADESGESGDGDGDPGDGDGDPTGDGDPGDGDGEPTGDGDNESEDGDGDNESGDGDGDPNGIPACGDGLANLKLELVEDTFLVAGPFFDQGCVVGWEDLGMKWIYGPPETPCGELDFGGLEHHWLCSGGPDCTSMWLGRFDVGGFDDGYLKVMGATLELHGTLDINVTNWLSLYSLDGIDPMVFGANCEHDWMAGIGLGEPPDLCVTTFDYSASPSEWTISMHLGQAIADAEVPGGVGVEHEVAMQIPFPMVEDWLNNNEGGHAGLVLQSSNVFRKQFTLHAQGSEKPPLLHVDVCVMP